MSAAPQRTRHLAPGDKLGKYEVIKQIAIGGMAELYLSRTLGIEGFEKLVVLKRILPQYGSNASFVTMFLNEARLAATLHHPNIAQVYDIGLEEGDYFFAMEYVHGEDLDHILIASEEQGVPLSMDAALTLVAGLCSGLNYAHEKMNAEGKPLGIVHRDVSPSNILVSYDGAVKLVDFGIARASSRPGTTQGGLKGKISYMSPEQCRARAQLDRRSDIYSAGVILYELTTGQLPFQGETEYQILNQIVNEDVPPPTSVVVDYPKHLERIVLTALAREPEHRYASAVQLQSDIEDFAHESRLRISPLVLARIMGTLFPQRLEEWDHAKSQGAFFVEQHVVRTLIESGKAPDPSDPQAKQDAAAKAAQDAMKQIGDDDPTALSTSFTELTDTTIGAPPIATNDSSPFERERATTEVSADVMSFAVPATTEVSADVASFTVPAPPEPVKAVYPMVTELMSATPGSLVTGAGKYGQVPTGELAKSEVTERVSARGTSSPGGSGARVPSRRQSSPTSLIRASAPVKKPVFAVAALVVVGGLIAMIFALTGRDAPRSAPREEKIEMQPTAAPIESSSESPTAAAPTSAPIESPVESPTAATPSVEPPPKAEPVANAEPAAKAAEPKKPIATKPKVEAKPAPKVSTTKTEKKPDPKKPDKETTWNSDSPFMPVRTGK